MNTLLVVFTGGTIGSRKEADSIDVDQATAYELIKLYGNLPNKSNVAFEILQPLNILSENLIVEDWTTLIACLNELDLTGYSGIVMTHGTDTLNYTAAALSFTFRQMPIPLVLIASNFPLNDGRGKGLNNFAHAIDFIENAALPGIYVLFENRLGEAIVHLGTRLLASDSYTDEFDSTYSEAFGAMVNRRFVHNPHFINPPIEAFRREKKASADLPNIVFSTEILHIKPHPGLDYRYYDFSVHKPRAILHELYHSGTACTRLSGTYRSSLQDFINYCISHDVAVYIAPLKTVDYYATSVQLLEAGAIPLEHISTEAALVKLMLAYGTLVEHDKAKAFMKATSLFFEVHNTD